MPLPDTVFVDALPPLGRDGAAAANDAGTDGSDGPFVVAPPRTDVTSLPTPAKANWVNGRVFICGDIQPDRPPLPSSPPPRRLDRHDGRRADDKEEDTAVETVGDRLIKYSTRKQRRLEAMVDDIVGRILVYVAVCE